MTSSSAKRQRTEDAPIARSEIWHDDGSLVLQAENTQFRVHWGVLSLNSPFFQNLKGLPQPPDQPSIEGCPVVELPDDAADVEYLLKALYIPTFLMQKKLPFPAAAALIRLGRKYDFKDVLNTTVERVTFENPATLEKYDALIVDRGRYGPRSILNYPGILYDMLSLAREHSIMSVLPCAYYRAILYQPTLIFDGTPRGDGTSTVLATIDQRRCVQGREKLIKAQFRVGYTHAWVRDRERLDCIDSEGCDTLRARLLDRFLDTLSLWALCGPTVELDTTVKQLCHSCATYARESMESGRKKIWDELPSFFDLPPWSELTNDL
ncbi:hypothetical protein DFH07DRAFT_850509 [Mycena maculata]|uniref:BTB domain-containing protein n=1 Tax=Mycena maculata TaxID=230809 RepID=A0AAD7MSU0_9AGAR|nr:hypothetical protein DFH07DRAFT_850509 [Mycena maculata]